MCMLKLVSSEKKLGVTILMSFFGAKSEFRIYGKLLQVSKFAHKCSPARVGLAQAQPNDQSWLNNEGVRTL